MKKTSKQSELTSLKKEVNQLKEELKKLKKEIRLLKNDSRENKELIQALKKSIQKETYQEDSEYLGFKLKKEWTTTTWKNKDGEFKASKIQKYYAKKRIKGKLHKIYIGKTLDKELVEEKVKTYLKKNKIKIPKKYKQLSLFEQKSK